MRDHRAEQTIHKPRMDVDDIGVDPNDDIASGNKQALPECLALPGPRPVGREDLLMNMNRSRGI
jgi:hypothetical protein